jgi:acyl carrier protein
VERAEIVSELRGWLEREFPNEEVELRENTHLLDEWFVDSLGIVEAVLFLEERFGVTLARADINAENFATLGHLADFVLARRAAGAA